MSERGCGVMITSWQAGVEQCAAPNRRACHDVPVAELSVCKQSHRHLDTKDIAETSTRTDKERTSWASLPDSTSPTQSAPRRTAPWYARFIADIRRKYTFDPNVHIQVDGFFILQGEVPRMPYDGTLFRR